MVLSDTHDFRFEDYPGQDFRQGLPKIDVLLHCGDLTQCGGIPSFKKALRMLGSIEADLKLVIAGNHDLELDKDYQATHLDEEDLVEEHDEAMDVWTGKAAEEAGVVFLSEGTYTFILKNGAKLTVYASPYKPEFCDWAFSYEHNLDRFNGDEDVDHDRGIQSIAENPVPSFPNIDIMMTHGPPKNILDECPQGHQGCDDLLRAASRAKPRLHCFGHIHESYGAAMITWQSNGAFVAEGMAASRTKDARHMLLSETNGLVFGTNTLMINAAIMTDNNEPLNLPWIVVIPLPRN
ncbi:MAG: hypothetical protein Q9165_003619 [Trypethelium subeluteriae]